MLKILSRPSSSAAAAACTSQQWSRAYIYIHNMLHLYYTCTYMYTFIYIYMYLFLFFIIFDNQIIKYIYQLYVYVCVWVTNVYAVVSSLRPGVYGPLHRRVPGHHLSDSIDDVHLYARIVVHIWTTIYNERDIILYT